MIKTTALLIVLCAVPSGISQAKPMDARAGERIPGIRRIVGEALTSNTLSQQDKAFVAECIQTRNDVLLSITAWLAGESQTIDEPLWLKLENLPQDKLDAMSSAFIRIAREKREARKSRQQWKPNDALLSDRNPFVRTEAARELLRLDRQQGLAAIENLRKDKQADGKFVAARLLEENRPPNRAPAYISDERYSLILSIIQRGGVRGGEAGSEARGGRGGEAGSDLRGGVRP